APGSTEPSVVQPPPGRGFNATSCGTCTDPSVSQVITMSVSSSATPSRSPATGTTSAWMFSAPSLLKAETPSTNFREPFGHSEYALGKAGTVRMALRMSAATRGAAGGCGHAAEAAVGDGAAEVGAVAGVVGVVVATVGCGDCPLATVFDPHPATIAAAAS